MWSKPLEIDQNNLKLQNQLRNPEIKAFSWCGRALDFLAPYFSELAEDIPDE